MSMNYARPRLEAAKKRLDTAIKKRNNLLSKLRGLEDDIAYLVFLTEPDASKWVLPAIANTPAHMWGLSSYTYNIISRSINDLKELSAYSKKNFTKRFGIKITIEVEAMLMALVRGAVNFDDACAKLNARGWLTSVDSNHDS